MLLLCLVNLGVAQQPIRMDSISAIPLFVGYYKTSNLIFPFSIKSVDKGSGDLLVQKAKGVNNVLQVKAAKKGFGQTNLSIVTADGKFYSFLVDYLPNPPFLNFSINPDSTAGRAPGIADLSGVSLTEDDYQALKVYSTGQKSFLHKHISNGQVKLRLEGIYLDQKAMILSLKLSNESYVDYLPDVVRLFIRDKRRAKRTAIQEKEVKPLYSLGKLTVAGKGSIQVLVPLAPLTIPNSQELIIYFGEHNGGRVLMLSISNKTLLKARPIEQPFEN